MARFSTPTPGRIPAGAVTSVAAPHQVPTAAPTFEGGAGFSYTEPHTHLFLASVSGLLKDQFYESGDARVRTLINLVPQCDPAWLRQFIPWLREVAHLRSAPVVLAAEYVRAKFPHGRQVVAGTLQRADEPGEILAYWRAQYGRALPMPLKRGVADAVRRLYNEGSMIRYDGQSKGWRFGDVIEVVHPKANAPWQNDLFRYALDRRKGAELVPESLLVMAADKALLALPEAERSLDDPRIDIARWNWERLGGWTKLDAAAWERMIPTMGYMALIRNLRNFEQAGVTPTVLDLVAQRIADPDMVAQSKQLPYRFLNAYKNVASDRWKWPLTQALELAVGNLPHFEGRTLVMVDCSGSMNAQLQHGQRGATASRSQIAALYGWSIAKRSDEAVVVPYHNDIVAAFTQAENTESVLKMSQLPEFRPNGGTYTWQSTLKAYELFGPFDRIVILTDEQAHDSDNGTLKWCPVITWNLAGYDTAHAAQGRMNRYAIGGYSDTVLECLPAVIGLGEGRWPWDAE